LSQSNPLTAVAEFVENSIDAHAQHVTIIRGRSRGKSYLTIMDDRDQNGFGPMRELNMRIAGARHLVAISTPET
jgi:DNA mismatch repair ATPase MutL